MGEINVYGNVHTFGETPPLTVYGPVLNVEQTRRNVWSRSFPHIYLYSDSFSSSLDRSCRYVAPYKL